ncbi:hypothetical protein N8987_04455, partial [Crocinitomix sp.]|nr:hypothetical protein [Crocinitomix sp.]
GLPQEMQCYNQFSIPYIYESFGDSVFIKNKLLANQMDREGLGDQPAKMNGKTDSVLNFFYQRIDPVFYKEFMNNQRNELRLYAQLYTNENGYIYDLYESGVKKHPLDSVLISLAKEVPYKLTPAIDDGKPAKGLVQIFFRLNENSIAIYEAFKEN